MQLLAVERLSDTGRQRLGILERQIRRMMRLLDSCSGQHTDITCSVPVDLSVMIRNVVSELDAFLERRGVEVRMTIRGFLPFVQGDGDLLHRVFVNVLVNAADSMGEGGCIEITAFTDGDPSSRVGMVHIQIADSGAGIPPEVTASAPCILVASGVHYSWWRATANGVDRVPERINHPMVGVPVSSGRSTVHLRVEFTSVTYGAGISMLAGLCWAGLAVVSAVRRPSSSRPAS